MSSLPQFFWLRCLEPIINRSPMQVEPETLVSEVIALMAKGGSDIFVLTNSQVIGWLSTQHIVKLMALGIDLTTTKISDVMQQPADITIEVKQLLDIQTVISQISQCQSSCLLVVDELGECVGTVSQASILQALATAVDIKQPAATLKLRKSSQYKLRQHRCRCKSHRVKHFGQQPTIAINRPHIIELKSAKNTNKTIYWERNLINNQIYFLNTIATESESEAIETVEWDEVLSLVHPHDREKVELANQSAIANLSSFEIEHRLLVLGETSGYKWVLARGTVLTNRAGQPTRMIGVTMEIDHQRKAQDTLQKTNQELEVELTQRAIALQDKNEQLLAEQIALANIEERFRFLAESIPQQVWIAQPDGSLEYINQRTLDFFGSTSEELLGWGWEKFVHPDDLVTCLAAWHHSLTTGSIYEQEFRLLAADSRTYRWHLVRGLPFKNQQGEIINWFGTNTDIDEQKHIEENLSHKVQLADFRAKVDTVLSRSSTLSEMMRGCTEAIVENLQAAFARIWILNKTENVLELQVSSGMYTHIDGAHGRIPIGQLKIGLIAQSGQPQISNAVQTDPQVRDQDWARTEGIVAFAGYPLIVEEETVGVIAMFSRHQLSSSTLEILGITAHEIALGIKRKQTEVALQESEERFRNLVEASSDWVWEVDENIRYVYVSPKVRDILGYEPEEVIGKTPLELMPPEEAERVFSVFAPIAAAQQPFKCLENTNLHKDGHLVVLETSGVPIFNCGGKFCGYRGIDRDITARKQAKTKLLETQAQLQAILDNSPAVIYLLDTQNRFLLINQQYERLFQTTQQEIIGKSIYEVWNADIADNFAVNNHLVVTHDTPIEVEEEVPHEDGLHTYISVKFPLRDSNGVPYAVCGISTDITDRKRAKNKLRQSEEYFRLLIESIKDYAIYRLDSQGRVMSWNSGAECITGYQTSDIVGQNFACFFPLETMAEYSPQQQLDIAASQGRCECERVFVRKDGSYFWANCILTPLRDAAGNLRGFSKVTRDITERKLAEESLLRFQKAIESTSDAVVITDEQGKSIYVNPAFVGLYGYNLEELARIGGIWVISQQPQDSQKILTAIHRGQSWRGEVAMRSGTGNILQIDLRIDAIKDTKGKIFGTVCIHTDITKRQQVEEGLRLRDRAIAASSNGIIIADASIANGPIIYVNPAFEKMTGYSSEEVIGQNFRLFYSPDINQPGCQELHSFMQAGKAGTVILQHYRKNGSLFWSELNVSPVYDQNDRLTHYIGIQTDITERQQAQTALLISQQRLQYLLTSSPAVIYACKTSGDFGCLFISENIKTLLGYEAKQFTEDSSFWLSRIHPEDAPKVFDHLVDVLEKRQYKLEYRFLHQDGSYRWLYDRGKVVWDDTHKPVELVGYMADITDRKQLEEELTVALEKEKELSELKSRFVSMTSHEFRTPLSIILSSSELLEHYHQKLSPEKQLTHLQRIQTAVKRMTEMLDDVLIIGKAEAGKLEFIPQVFDLVAYCRNLVAETQTRLRLKSQQINFTSHEETIECCMDDKLLTHILNNLLSNAIKYSHENSRVEFILKTENEQAIFEIQDSGIGIPPEDIPQLFESFHRAKNVGNIPGTGLGLAIVKKCIDLHQGEIFVKSALGIGTVFTVKISLNNQI
ncbi:PAS domain S-box protein [Aliinostoc sp. HNIBRCY26]|uniref:PAS domain S-box protein n=1 Tax=Aliinostoc sp. HNIBRCY26 TaxID=3418997 RepID=UPI003CFD8B99